MEDLHFLYENFVINPIISPYNSQGESLIMINLAVINLKTLLKRIAKIIVAILVLAMVIKFVKILYQCSQEFEVKNLGLKSNLSMIKNNLNFSKFFEEDKKEKTSELKKILVAELAVFLGSEEEIMEKENQEEIIEFENIEKGQKENAVMQEAQVTQEATPEPKTQQQPSAQLENVQTTVIEQNNKKDVYTDIYQSVRIKNESDYSLTEEMVTPNIKLNNTKDIIIYHTHTCESYTPTENSQYVATGNYRTTDSNYSVARVGTELANQLAGKGYTAIHDTTFHDYPAYTGSYTRSLSTVKNLLNTYPNVECVFDIHRDALRKQQ